MVINEVIEIEVIETQAKGVLSQSERPFLTSSARLCPRTLPGLKFFND